MEDRVNKKGRSLNSRIRKMTKGVHDCVRHGHNGGPNQRLIQKA